MMISNASLMDGSDSCGSIGWRSNGCCRQRLEGATRLCAIERLVFDVQYVYILDIYISCGARLLLLLAHTDDCEWHPAVMAALPSHYHSHYWQLTTNIIKIDLLVIHLVMFMYSCAPLCSFANSTLIDDVIV